MKSKAALLLIDVINDLDFAGAEAIQRSAQPVARRICSLATRARAARMPVIYVNDNFGKWQSDWRAQVEFCSRPESRGRKIVEILRPLETDYFVLKPKHSGFYCTTLDVLLAAMGVDTLILAGIAGNICVLFTANDAHMREFRLLVPQDCIASNSSAINRYALTQMESVLAADISPSGNLTGKRLRTLVMGHDS
jgi:nicotinamidase-related amidase